MYKLVLVLDATTESESIGMSGMPVKYVTVVFVGYSVPGFTILVVWGLSMWSMHLSMSL